MVNQWHGIGNIGRDPESRFTGNGAQVASFSLAVNKRHGKGDDKKQETTWLRVNAWNKLAEIVMEYMKKGQQVYVCGELEVREYESKGEKKTSVDIIAHTIQRLGGPKTNGNREPGDEANAGL